MQGLIFIPDISGFTNFVNSVDIDLGVSVIQELLNEIINNNPLDVELSEIEGDAILYYKIGKPISLNNLFAAFKKISAAFDTKFSNFKKQYDFKSDLSLKFIVHYGNINVYQIKNFKQLYGETVIESHRLLKNGSEASKYVLITQDYINALDHTSSENKVSKCDFKYFCSGLFNGLRKFDYYYYNCFPGGVMENSYIRA